MSQRVVALELRSAFHEPGCPLCQVRCQSEHRYLFYLLWENVNNMSIRIALSESMGFCSEHSWQLYRVAVDLGEETGMGILYEDLLSQVAAHLAAFYTRLPNCQSVPQWLVDVGIRIRAALHIPKRRQIPAGRRCPACVRGDQTEEHNLAWLVQGCAESEFRARYASSDGLCLSHLRQALALAERTDPRVARFLARITKQRLEALAGNLHECVRKHAWDYRHEPMAEPERTSVRRASVFFGGKDRCNPQANRSVQPAQHLTTEHLKQMGLRIDE